MIIFHEGMPGSGKSFAAMKDHIIPALQKGRKVFARMNGLDRAKIAEVSGCTNEEISELLVDIEEGQVSQIYRFIEKDALVVIDELQNFFPKSRGGLQPEMIKFIAEHRHHGLDILCMGQLLKDCHSTWLNRVNRKIQFLNKDVLGKPNEYKWKMFNGTPDGSGNVKFTEVTAGSSDYDPKYFGTYRSFRQETENTDRLADNRAVIWNNPVFKKWLPILGVCVLGAGWYVFHLFSGGLTADNTQAKTAVKPIAAVTETYQDGKLVTRTTEGKVKESPKHEPDASEWPDPVADYTRANRIRLAGVLRTNKHTKIALEWRDESNRVIDQMTGEQLRLLGWSVMVGDDDQTVLLTNKEKRLFATAWPIADPVGKVTNDQNDKIREESRKMGSGLAPVAPLALAQ